MRIFGFGIPSMGQVENQMRGFRILLSKDVPYDLSQLKIQRENDFKTILLNAELLVNFIIDTFKGKDTTENDRSILKKYLKEVMGILSRAKEFRLQSELKAKIEKETRLKI